LCEFIDINRCGYYRWLKRLGTKTKGEEHKESVKVKIKKYHELYPTKGYRNIRREIMREDGWIVSLYMMYQCFKEMGIASKARRKAYRRPKGVSDKYPNLINNDWFVTRPFEKVCSDTTMVVHQGKKYDWNFHVDVFNNEIVGWDIANYQHGNGVMNHLRSLKDFLRIKEERGYQGNMTILHSDQGLVYASKKFAKAHKQYRIRRSMSRAATPTDNPVIEALNGWIKSELKYNLRINEYSDINTAIELYVNYFNHSRPAWRLDYLSPIEYRTLKGVK
jgi:transposase InsO family protein